MGCQLTLRDTVILSRTKLSHGKDHVWTFQPGRVRPVSYGGEDHTVCFVYTVENLDLIDGMPIQVSQLKTSDLREGEFKIHIKPGIRPVRFMPTNESPNLIPTPPKTFIDAAGFCLSDDFDCGIPVRLAIDGDRKTVKAVLMELVSRRTIKKRYRINFSQP